MPLLSSSYSPASPAARSFRKLREGPRRRQFRRKRSTRPCLSARRRRPLTRRNRSGRRRGPARRPPPPASHSTRKTSVAQDTQPISSSVPCHQAKKNRHTRKDNLSSGKPKLPENFVKRKRAYFEEIDAFELGEEAYL